MQIREKVELLGVPLKNWNIQINYGVKTGFNEAFIIDSSKRQELIEADAKSEEIIKPILRGRDIKRYSHEYANLFLITTFPSLKINIENYPAVKKHLLSFGYDRLKQTGEPGARKKTHNQWFETQDSIGYWDDFNRQKIVWGEISDKAKFCIDLNGGFMTEATTFLLTGDSLLYLLGFLNSKFSEYFFSKIGTTTGVGTVRWKKFTVEQLPVPIIPQEDRSKYDVLVRKIISLQSKKQDCSDEINTLNNLIYCELGLTTEEIEYINNQ